MISAERTRLRLVCRGAVQGVGFRPAVHRLANALGLAGWVRNGPEGAVIEIEGSESATDAFTTRLGASLPRLARLASVDVERVVPVGETRFEVVDSVVGPRERAMVPPDAALCEECRKEMEDPSDRRFHFPFTTCTGCGPRFSLVAALPYDRARTSMACFPLCPDCAREYTDPHDRRFHAEPVCCPQCGPRLWLVEPGVGPEDHGARPGRAVEGGTALQRVRQELAAGSIVAIKGIGGFQLACRIDDDSVVSRLRERKRRPTKPFAVMARDLEVARTLVELDARDADLLTSPAAPVLLAPRRNRSAASIVLAPGLEDLGVMLPTTPLHVELFRDTPYDALVMTSGNASDEPICRSNREALERLGTIADLFLLHDRDIVRRVDDSVVRTAADGPLVVRRARGRVPEPLPLPVECRQPLLGLGGHLQVTACLAVGAEAFPSQHVGDLDTDEARAFLAEVVDGLEEFLEVRGRLIVVDGHPDYASTRLGERLANDRGARLLRVQHHLAHAAAVLAEHGSFPGLGERAAAIALDGTGWGEDATAWGGEWLLITGELRWMRLARLAPLPLVGGEAAVREPWRVAVAALVHEGCEHLLNQMPLAALVPPATVKTVARLAAAERWPLASGAGRLFEAAGALLGLAAANGYEGEAAARLEALASTAWVEAAPWPEVTVLTNGPVPQLPGAELLAAAARRFHAGEPAHNVAAGFHETFCHLVAALTKLVVPSGLHAVALGGGCMVNRLLREGLVRALDGVGLGALLPRELPPGDGGLAFGQVVVGGVADALGVEPSFEGS